MKFPVIETLHTDVDLQNVLVRKCKSIGDEQKRKTNVKADMTNFFMHETDKDFEAIANKAIELAHDNNPLPVNLKMSTYDCWGAVYKKGDMSRRHDHWPYIWSWVYNVECCDNCTPLVFNDTTYSIKPKVGRLTMFPGWIKHSVPEHKCDHDRIVVAGNISEDPHNIISKIKSRNHNRINPK
jgi:hypothetical protein|tara:strand:+ start:1117 stop:1662 length:546 start_codon:yes stop_codon:yes gene_type:complete